jgi:hypothetical protein
MTLAVTEKARFNPAMLKWLALVGMIAACTTRANPAYCDESSDCKNGFVCNLTTHGCEAESDVDAAVDSGPGSCALDDECTSGVCREDGTCEAAENILYVAPDGISAGACPESSRCDLVYALSTVTTIVSTIRLANGTYDLASDIVIDQPNVSIVGGRSAVLKRSAPGPVINVRGIAGSTNPTLTLRGITSNKGVACEAGTIRLQRALFDNAPSEAIPWIATDDCDLLVESSELRDSPAAGISGEFSDLEMVDSKISGSTAGGISISYTRAGGSGVNIRRSTIELNIDVGIKLFNAASFRLERSTIINNRTGGVSSLGSPYDVTNNFIVRNGSQGLPTETGGIRLTGSGRVIQNTIAMNQAPPDAPYAGGIYCDNGTAANNIIAANQRGNEELPFAQNAGNCSYGGSLIATSYMTPVFIDVELGDNFHIASASPAVNAGGAPQVDVDFDGEPRTDGAADLGADERP